MLNLLLGLLISAIPLPAKPARYVTDNAAVLSADRAQKLDKQLEQFEKQTSDQLIVYIDKKVPDGTTLEEMGAQAIHEWGIGQKSKNNGVILFLFTDDRKMRIEVGYGLEGSLTDAKSKLITSSIMKPRLRNGDYAGAVEQGVAAILNTIKGEPFRGSGHTAAEAKVSSASDAVPPLMLAFFGLVFILGLIAFIRTLIRSPRAAFASGRSSRRRSWSSDDSSSSSSDSGGSDFSGGGGDGGGGGSSDSW
jgi:uncharacterized protein